MAYKDIYNWAEQELKLNRTDLAKIKRYEFQHKCGEVQSILDLKFATKNQLDEAIKKVYNLTPFHGDLSELTASKSISTNIMIDQEFIAANYGTKPGTYILLTNPSNKLSIVNLVKTNVLEADPKVLFIYYDDFLKWQEINKKDINDSKINASMSKIEGSKALDSEMYAASDSDVNAESITGIVNKIIIEAVEAKASDIHIEPCENEIRVRYRIDGVLRTHTTIANKAIHSQIVNRIKILANMDTNNFQTPQSGKINMIIKGVEVDMRISTLPSLYGEKVTTRILVSKNVKIRTLEQLGLPPKMREEVAFLAAHPHGIIIVTGPTGSGKSSTLASVLSSIVSPETCLVTIEDPVEYKVPGATQVNVSDATGLTFASVLRETLRQDPDIIMIGEIRDIETAKIAITASNTGHLVFSTLHTNGAVATIGRLMDMGVESYMISDNVIGVLSQRLVKVLCPHCRQEHILDEEDYRKYRMPKSMIGKMAYSANPKGCEFCHNGYAGRTVVPELMILTKKIQEAIHLKKSSQEIEEIAQRQGMIKQEDYAYSLVLNGKTTIQEVFKIYGGSADEETDD